MKIKSAFKITTIIISSLLSQIYLSDVMAQSYNNPVIGTPQKVDREIPDPHVLKWNGEYYLYTSGDPITAYHSTDLVNWQPLGAVLTSSSNNKAWNQSDVWAPEVIYRNGKFYMYYTASKKSDDWRVGEMARRVGVAVSNSPKGPFIDSGKPVSQGWAIDGNVFKDPDGGKEYLFYSYLHEPKLPGASIVMDPMKSWNSVTGNLTTISRGNQAWEDKDGDENNGSLRYTNEAPTVIKHHKLYYMIYSGGSWDLPSYSLAYAVTDKIKQDGLEGPGWKKVSPPILRSTPIVDGPGHNSIVKAPNNVDDINVFHARTVPFIDPWNRLPFVDRIYWNHDNIFMPNPSIANLSAPDKPLFADNFNSKNNNDISNRWQINEGKSSLADNQLNLSENSFALARSEKLINYVFEANFKALENFDDSKLGVSAYYVDNQNYIDALVVSNTKMVISGKLQGKNLPEHSITLAKYFNINNYHQLIVTKNSENITLTLDEVNIFKSDFDINPLTPASVGLKTQNIKASFDGIALTSYFDDTFDETNNNWEAKSGTWLAEEGALHQVEGGNKRHVTFKGQKAMNYEFTASVKLRDNDLLSSKVGIVAASANNKMIVGGFDKTIWPEARFWVQEINNGNVVSSFGVPTPRGFDYTAYHTIRSVKQGSAITFYLDGKEIAASNFDIAEAQPGLFTEGSRAAFDDCSLKTIVSPQNLVLNSSFETDQWDGSSASPNNPWVLTGNARVNECCAHTGQKRLIINGANGSAKQTIKNLVPGHYRLSAYITDSGKVKSKLSVNNLASSNSEMIGGKWTKLIVDFNISQKQSIDINFSSGIKSGSNDFSAIDDIYLEKLEK